MRREGNQRLILSRPDWRFFSLHAVFYPLCSLGLDAETGV